MNGHTHFKDETAVDDLIAVMKEDVRPMIRGTAAWALGKIGGKKAQEAIEHALEKEQDERVIVEMEKGLRLVQERDRKSTRLNSSHVAISYAVFCLKKKKKKK